MQKHMLIMSHHYDWLTVFWRVYAALRVLRQAGNTPLDVSEILRPGLTLDNKPKWNGDACLRVHGYMRDDGPVP